MAYSLNTDRKITKFAPENYNSETQTTTITGFAENVGIKSLSMGERGLSLVFYRIENGEELTVELPVYEPKSEKQGNFQLANLKNTLFSAFGKKSELTVSDSEDWNTIVLALASNFNFPSPVQAGSKLKVVLNKKGWQTVSNQFPIFTSNIFAQKVEFNEGWDNRVFTKVAAEDVNSYATKDTPISDLISNQPTTSDDLPF